MSLSPGKIRALQTASSVGGTFKILAIDHRDSLRVLINPEHPEAVTEQMVTEIKLDIIKHIAPAATAVMLDPVYSAAQAIVTSALPGSVGFLCALEAQGYAGEPTARETQLLNGWSVEKAKRLGASAVKLLVYYHPDAGMATTKQEATISAVIQECTRYDIPLFLEPLYYSPDPAVSVESPDFAASRRYIVIETVRRLGALQPDVLKIQFPIDSTFQPDVQVWKDACAELDEVSLVPWALLSGGDPYEIFKLQVETACQAGCSGFMVGRALWREVIKCQPEDRGEVMQSVVMPRFDELASIVDAHGHNWRTKHALPAVHHDWFMTY